MGKHIVFVMSVSLSVCMSYFVSSQ